MDFLIRRASPKDAAAVAAHMADPAVFGGLMQLPFPSEEQWRVRLEEGVKDPTGIVLLAVAGDAVIGTCGLHPEGNRLRRKHVLGLGISVSKACWGQGVGKALMAALMDYADNWAGALRVELTVFADNARAIALYKKFGFFVEGTHRAYAMRNGALADVLSMARFHPKPPRLPTDG
jgi:putative acetyltransferase